ncbi:MAG: hypothetical protein EAZ87_18995 [Nostocales cyanobacterium]|nr:MAG: hypothetical protein EAZ87_18995 [Nostocales cyanobacterium]
MNRNLLSSACIPALIFTMSAPVVSIPLITQPAYAETVSFTFLKSFGRDGNTYKVMVQSQRGNRFFVWYFDSLNTQEGQEVLIEINGSGNWTDISNPGNGRTSKIWKVERVR